MQKRILIPVAMPKFRRVAVSAYQNTGDRTGTEAESEPRRTKDTVSERASICKGKSRAPYHNGVVHVFSILRFQAQASTCLGLGLRRGLSSSSSSGLRVGLGRSSSSLVRVVGPVSLIVVRSGSLVLDSRRVVGSASLGLETLLVVGSSSTGSSSARSSSCRAAR